MPSSAPRFSSSKAMPEGPFARINKKNFMIYFVYRSLIRTFAAANGERCQSGRMDRTRNAAYSYGYPGFESQSLRLRKDKKGTSTVAGFPSLHSAVCVHCPWRAKGARARRPGRGKQGGWPRGLTNRISSYRQNRMVTKRSAGMSMVVIPPETLTVCSSAFWMALVT